jgi:hypothetical protein
VNINVLKQEKGRETCRKYSRRVGESEKSWEKLQTIYCGEKERA